MSTLSEIEDAIRSLSDSDRELLEARMISRRFGLDDLKAGERDELLKSLDEAEREIDLGLGVSADQLRKAVRSWTGG
jgi:hypothetical protein